jgi:type III secretory pathway component EscS
MMGNRIERYTYPSFVGAILLAIVFLVAGVSLGAAALIGVAGLIALLHARVGLRDRSNAFAAALMAGVTVAFLALVILFDYL